MNKKYDRLVDFPQQVIESYNEEYIELRDLRLKIISMYPYSVLNRKALMIGLVILWGTMQFWLYYTGGIRPAGDTGRYIGAAEILLSGHLPLTGKAMSYLAYDGIVAIFLGLGWGQEGVIIFQVLISGIAACTLYLLTTYLYDWRAGVVAALLFISFPDIQKWNYYILTESLFISTIIFTTYIVLTGKGWQRIIVGGILVLLATFMRPNGFIVPMALSIYILVWLWQNGKRRLVAGILVIAVIALAMASIWIGGMLSKERVLSHYIDGTVIWGHPESALSMPGQEPDCRQVKGSAIFEIACFTAAKPLYMIELAGMKLFYFFLLARPYYSVAHNAVIISFLLPVYTLALIAWYRGRKEFVEWAFPAMMIFLQAVVVAFTFADWDSRHLQVVLPLIFIFASGCVAWLMDSLASIREKQA